MDSPILFVGLGNPGFRYVNTRHNIGFLFVDIIQSLCSYPEFKYDRNLAGEISSLKTDSREVILLKPDTYMNLSGKSVLAAISFYNVLPQNIFVVHDDMDFDFGRQKIKIGGGSAGHNGVQSIIDYLSNPEFYRIRLGIAKKDEERGKDFVLGLFADDEMEFISAGWASRWKELFLTILEDGPVKAMNLFNKA